MKTQNIQNAIRILRERLIKRFGKGLKIYLFGSIARGDYDADSDIDVLVLLPFESNHSVEEEIFDIAYDIELDYDVVFGIIVYSLDFWISHKARAMPLYKIVDSEGIPV